MILLQIERRWNGREIKFKKSFKNLSLSNKSVIKSYGMLHVSNRGQFIGCKLDVQHTYFHPTRLWWCRKMPFAVALNKANFHANGKQIQTLIHFSSSSSNLFSFSYQSNLIFISISARCSCLFFLSIKLRSS